MSLSAPSFEFPGTERFEIVSLLGAGGMGMVYKALDRDTRSHVALKVLEQHSPAALIRFKHEFRVLQDMDHPNLVALGELGEAGGHWFFTMELVEGRDFLAHVCPGDRLDEGRLRHALAQLARGLDALHRARVIHRDVKPSNLIVTAGDRVVLLDFGLALGADGPDGLLDEPIAGTAAYMAPEQARPGATGPASDWYAVGVVLYQALCGRLPFTGAAVEMLDRKRREPPEPPSRHAPGTSPELDALCVDLLAADPERRPGAAEILRRLGHADDAPARPARPAIAAEGRADAVFVGREAELAELAAALSDDTLPCTVLVQGESGVGKTALVREFLARATGGDDADGADGGDDAAVRPLALTGRCYERENVPFKGIDGVVDALARHLRGLSDRDLDAALPAGSALLGQTFPSLHQVPGLRRRHAEQLLVVDPRELRRRAFAALRGLLGRLAAERPMLIAIDDVQWAGPDTWQLIEHLLAPPEAPRALLVLTARTRREGGGHLDLAALPGLVRRIGLSPLPPDDARALTVTLLGARSGDQLAGDVANTLAREAGGHPLFVRTLVAHVLAIGDSKQRHARLEDALVASFDQLPDDALDVLRLIAVAGVPAAQAVIADAAGLDLSGYLRAVAPLRSGYLVRTTGTRAADTVEHAHDRIRAACLDVLSDGERRALHRRLADALERAGMADTAPRLLLAHLAAARGADADADADERAAKVAEHAAEHAASVLAFDQAVTLYETALSLGEDTATSGEPGANDTRRRRLLSLADALVHAGRGEQAAERFLEAAELGDDWNRVDCRSRAAAQLLYAGHIERGVAVLADVLAEIGESLSPTPRRALISLVWQRLRLRLRGLRFTPRGRDDVPRDLRLRLEAYSAVGAGLGLIDNIRAADFQTRHLRAALDAGELTQIIRALSIEAVFLASQRANRGRVLAARARALADEFGDPVSRAESMFGEGAVAYFMDNRWADAIEILAESEALLLTNQQTAGWETDSIHIFRCFCLMYRGELDELSSVVRAHIRAADQRGDLYASVSFRSRVILPWLVEGDSDGAARQLETAMEAWTPWTETFSIQHFYGLHSMCELALYLGEPERAARYMAEQLPYLARSQLLRVPMVVAEIEYLRGRIALQLALASQDDRARRRHLADVQRAANRLGRGAVPIAPLTGGLLAAAARRVAGEREAAIARLASLLEPLVAGGHGLFAGPARYWLGRLLAGEDARAHRDAASDWLRAQRVADPDRLCELLVPGWRESW